MIGWRPLTIGLVANEFFDPSAGRMGGFGWAVSRVARVLADDPALGVTPVIIAGERVSGAAAASRALHGVRFLPCTWHRWSDGRRLRAARPDLLLAIDYRPSYRRVFRELPETPVIIWVRDPRTADDNRLVASVRMPGRVGVPDGLGAVACGTLALEMRARQRAGSPMCLAVTDPFLGAKVEDTYGVRPDHLAELPNPIEPGPARVEKSLRPTVVFLGRLDPVKRPWVCTTLAGRFPDVEFLVLGQAHFSGQGAWQPVGLPPNVTLLGHVDGERKRRALAAAWTLVNTSVHEALAVSFLEALACQTPLLAMVDAGGLVSRFGVAVGQSPGTGLDRVDALADGLQRLLGDRGLRERLGREGRDWVARHHGRGSFLTALGELARRMVVQ